MSGNPWHRRYHSDALAGMLSLTLEERGAYQTVLDLIYDRGGPIADNERLLAGYMNCSIRKWRALRASLIEQGKLVASEGRLTNPRAEKQLENDAKTARKLAENGAKGGRKRAENLKKGNENNGSALAPLDGGFSLPEARSQSVSISKEKETHKARAPVRPGEVSDGVWRDFLAVRKAKRAPLTETALTAIQREADSAGWALEDALAECVTRGWQSFKAAWVQPATDTDAYPDGHSGVPL